MDKRKKTRSASARKRVGKSEKFKFLKKYAKVPALQELEKRNLEKIM
jgi:hypothetical protein